jgi:hypothetical protein
MKITVSPDLSPWSTPQEAMTADWIPPRLRLAGPEREFLDSLNVNPRKWHEDQLIEFGENDSFRVFGIDICLKNESWLMTDKWIWKFEVIEGSNRFFINENLIASDVIKLEGEPNVIN